MAKELTFETKAANRIRLRTVLFFLFPIAYVLQNPTLAAYEDTASGPKLHHLAACLLFAASAYRIPAAAVRAALIYGLTVAISGLINSRMDTRMLNAFGFLLIFLAAAAADEVDRVWARRGALVGAGVILVVMLAQLPLILSSAAENVEGRPLYPTLLAGGVNIEVCTLAILLVWSLLTHRRSLTGFTALLFLVTQTRTIFLVIPALLLTRGRGVATDLASALHRPRLKWWVGFASLAFGATIVVSVGGVDVDNITARLLNSLGEEPGSQGRALLYLVGINAAECYVLGCGVGSASDLIRASSLSYFFEDNFHNVFLQQLVEVGIAGLAAYGALFWLSYRRAMRRLYDPGLAAAIAATFLMSFLQFNGYEFLTGLLLGFGFSRSA